jgi:hypothetical protein
MALLYMEMKGAETTDVGTAFWKTKPKPNHRNTAKQIHRVYSPYNSVTVILRTFLLYHSAEYAFLKNKLLE